MLGYSCRQNVSCHPRNDYKRDLSALGENVLVMVGEDDEQNEAAMTARPFGECDAKALSHARPEPVEVVVAVGSAVGDTARWSVA